MPDTKIGKVDGLGKRLDWKVRVENDNYNQIFIKDCWLHSLHEVVIVKKIKKARSKDKEIVRVVKEMKKTEIKVLREDEW